MDIAVANRPPDGAVVDVVLNKFVATGVDVAAELAGNPALEVVVCRGFVVDDVPKGFIDEDAKGLLLTDAEKGFAAGTVAAGLGVVVAAVLPKSLLVGTPKGFGTVGVDETAEVAKLKVDDEGVRDGVVFPGVGGKVSGLGAGAAGVFVDLAAEARGIEKPAETFKVIGAPVDGREKEADDVNPVFAMVTEDEEAD